MKLVTHVIFDLDGLLLDTEPIYQGLSQEFVRLHGKDAESLDTLRQQFFGRGDAVTAQMIIDHFGLPVSVEDFLAWRNPKLLERFLEAAALPGAEQLIKHLHAHQIPIGLATSSARTQLTAKIKNHPWFQYFQNHLMTGDDPAIKNPKPAPDLFLAAAHQIQADPKMCLVFEDAPSGVEAALTADMSAVAIPNPQSPPDSPTYQNLKKLTADHGDRVQFCTSLLNFKPAEWGLPAFGVPTNAASGAGTNSTS